MPIYDITVPIRSGMPVYEGDPGIEIQPWSAFAKGDSANVSFLHFGAHTGTHVDAPAHFIEGARKIDALSLEALIGPARVIRVPDEVTEIDPDFLATADLDQVDQPHHRAPHPRVRLRSDHSRRAHHHGRTDHDARAWCRGRTRERRWTDDLVHARIRREGA